MYCLKCGKQIEDGSDFCMYCGTDQSGKTVKRDIIHHAPLKERLQNSLGTAGIVLWYFASLLLLVAPILILDFPWYITIIIGYVILSFNKIGGIIEFALYIWAFIVTLNGSQNTISIIFYICAAIYAITSVIPTVFCIVVSLFDNSGK